MKQQIKEWYKKSIVEPTPNLYIVDGVELTFKEIVQKARADVGGKIVVEGKEFSCRFFDEAEKWEKWRVRAFWTIMTSLYCFAFLTMLYIFHMPFINTMFLAIPLILLAFILIFTSYVHLMVGKHRKIFRIEDLELEILDMQQKLERMKENRE